MLSVVAYLSVKEDSAEAFEKSFLQSAARVHSNEPGCLLYQLCKDRKVKGKFTVIELYQDAEALKVHQKNLVANADPAQAAMFAGPPEVLVMPVIGPPGAKAGTAKLAIVAELPVKDGDGFEKATLPLIEEVQAKEKGNLLYCFGKHPKEPKFVVTELYTDKEAIQHHGGTEYFKAGGKRQAPFMGGAPKMSIMEAVGPSGAKPTAKL
eukprot:CAMPEP_0197898808 /NCGR_PEP_ID=MMETSP1439-20131203/44918_1 /TAXON_ID=66791 /ORGANISM="Gonyaulax spinifera, Strain CCMP409" /LENGTH=207 /DNA_ID=CAMNT_0043519561 /DNA_START=80 /DNA_END=703 /DNA_ORIENTATION=+